MTNPLEASTASVAWAWAIQRELDNLQKTINSRYAELSVRLDKVVSSTEYIADKRAEDQQHSLLLDRVNSLSRDVELFKRNFNERLESIRREHDIDIDKIGLLLDAEKKTREADRKEDHKEWEDDKERASLAQVEKKRWLIAAVILPTVLALVSLLQVLLK